MVEKLSAQQNAQLNNYLKEHPKISRADAIKLLFKFDSTKNDNDAIKGFHLEHKAATNQAKKQNNIAELSKKYPKCKIEVKKSGHYTVTSTDGSVRYFSANGVQITEKYFKGVESGKIKPANSASNGNSKPKTPQQILLARCNTLDKNLHKARAQNGFIGKSWDWFKNATDSLGIFSSSKKVEQEIAKEKQLLAQYDKATEKEKAKIFEQLTGVKYSKENEQELLKPNGKIKLKSSTHLEEYKDGQKTAVDITSDFVSGAAAFALAGVAIGAAPVTGGASLLLLPAVGAGVKVGIKYLDAKSGGRKYDSLGYDLLMGSVNGAIAPFTAGAGGAVAKTVATRMGIQVVKEGAKQVAKEGAKQAIKKATIEGAKRGFLRTLGSNMVDSMKSPGAYKFVGGKLSQRLGITFLEGSVDGSLSGGVISGVETAHNGGSAKDIVQASVMGTITGGIMGGGMNSATKELLPAFNGLFKKSSSDSVSTTIIPDTPDTGSSGAFVRKNEPQSAIAKPKTQTSAKQIKTQEISSKTNQIHIFGRIKNFFSDIKDKVKEKFTTNEYDTVVTAHKTKPDTKNGINIPTGKLGAPGAKFAETDEAFKGVLTNKKYDVLYMHQKYKITGDLDGLIDDMYSHYVRETDIGNLAPELKIERNTGNNAGSFMHDENRIMISKDYIDKESTVAHNVAHELNHWFQTKEMLITTPEGPELLAYNRVIGNLKEMVKNGDITSQKEIDKYLREWTNEDAANFRITYKDLLESTKYPHNNDPSSPYFQKANQYFEAEMNYEHTGDNYWGNFTEVESERRGLDAQNAYEQIINQDLSLENQAIDMIMEIIGNRFDTNKKLSCLKLAIAHLQEPRFSSYSVDEFVSWFLNRYL